MRWPFHFGRRVEGERVEAEPSTPPRRRDWESMPRIQRAVAEMQLTAPTHEFVESLAGEQHVDVSAGDLGHELSLEAPRGLVTGVARTFETYSSSSELLGRRRTRPPTRVQRRVHSDPEAEIEEPGESATAEDQAAAVPAFSLQAIDSPLPSYPPLTRLDDAVLAAMAPTVSPRPQRASAADEHVPPARVPGLEPGEAAPPGPVQRLTLGQSRRQGLGPPLPPRAVASLHRSQDQSPAQDSPTRIGPVHTMESRSEPAVSGARPRTEDVQPGSGAPSTELVVADAPARKRSRFEPEDSGEPPSHPTNALHPLAAPAIQRVAARNLPSLLPPPASRGVETVPLVPGRSPLPVSTREREASTEPGSTTHLLPRRAAQAPGLEPPPEPAVAANPVVLWSAPGEERGEPRFSAVPQALPLPLSPVAQRAMLTPERGAAVRRLDLPAPTAQLVASGAGDMVLQRLPISTEGPAAEGSPAPASASPALAVAPAPGESLAAAGPSPAAPGPGAAQGPGSPSEKDMNDLARQLFDPILSLLRREVLIDRERAGMLTDLR